MRRMIVALLLVLLVPLVSFSAAQDPTSPYCTLDPDDDSGLPLCFTPADNECYEGGEMDARCSTVYDWIIGWYLARYNQGMFTRDDMPAWIASSLFPPEPEPSNSDTGPATPANCLNLVAVALPDDDILLDFGLDHQLATIFEARTRCTVPLSGGGIRFAMVFASSQSTAEAMCNTYFGVSHAWDYTSVYPDLWRCHA